MGQDERNRPWLYPQRQEHADDKRKGLPTAPRLWPTIILAVAVGLAVAMLAHGRPVDPLAETIRHTLAQLWS